MLTDLERLNSCCSTTNTLSQTFFIINLKLKRHLIENIIPYILTVLEKLLANWYLVIKQIIYEKVFITSVNDFQTFKND